ncbi:GHMP family kinase ATP-binding protein [Streptomyces sulfonofaciens]|nr:GHMP kinase [Streptomyces sulfonofaciens]
MGVSRRGVLPDNPRPTALAESEPHEEGHEGAGPEALVGIGTAPSHHGELLQGAFEDHGEIRRGLVTLPCSLFGSSATIRLSRWEPELSVRPKWKTKSLSAVRGVLGALGMEGYGGRLELHGDVAVGRGLGSSSSDVTAAILAVLSATGRHLPPERIARIAAAAEVATDPLIFDRMLLFAQREGVVIEDFHRPAPSLEVVGFAFDDQGLDTLSWPPARYTSWEIECFRALRGLLRRAVEHGHLAELGRIATASARINQRFLPVPRFERVLDVAAECGALGVQVAHSGTIAGLLFDARRPELERQAALAGRRLRELHFSDQWRYNAGSDNHASDVRQP